LQKASALARYVYVAKVHVAGGTDVNHRVTVQRGPSPSGPWENNPANPILFNGANPSLGVQSSGHADMVQAKDGRWWGTALATRPQGGNFSHQQLGNVLSIVTNLY
jgi:beta-xylosidase